MEKLHVLGTGYALATRVYNTCFAITNEQGTLLVDASGGNGTGTGEANSENTGMSGAMGNAGSASSSGSAAASGNAGAAGTANGSVAP